MTETPATFEVSEAPGLAIRYRDPRWLLIGALFAVAWWGALVVLAILSGAKLWFLDAIAGVLALFFGLWFGLRRRALYVDDRHVIVGDWRPMRVPRDQIDGLHIVRRGGWYEVGLGLDYDYRLVDHEIVAILRDRREVVLMPVRTRDEAHWVVAKLERELRFRDAASAAAAGASN